MTQVGLKKQTEFLFESLVLHFGHVILDFSCSAAQLDYTGVGECMTIETTP
jgi:hypothetical protein